MRIALTAITLATLSIGSIAQTQSVETQWVGQKMIHPQPPIESIIACAGKIVGSTCNFTTSGQLRYGICLTPPARDAKPTALLPPAQNNCRTEQAEHRETPKN